MENYKMFLVVHDFYFNASDDCPKCRFVCLYIHNKEVDRADWTVGASSLFYDPAILNGCPFVPFDEPRRAAEDSLHGITDNEARRFRLDHIHSEYLDEECDSAVRTQDDKIPERETVDCYHWPVESFLAGQLPADLKMTDLIGAVMPVRYNGPAVVPLEEYYLRM